MSKRKNKLVPFETIVLATQGDPQALEQVIRHYRPYILSLCRREYIAENGNVSIVCDNGSEADGKNPAVRYQREDIQNVTRKPKSKHDS